MQGQGLLSTASLPWGNGATRNFGATLDGDPLQLKRTTRGRFVRWVSVLWVMVWGEMSVPQAGHIKDVASSDCIHALSPKSQDTAPPSKVWRHVSSGPA